MDWFSYPTPGMSRYPARLYFPVENIKDLGKNHSLYQAPVLKVLKNQGQTPDILSH